MTGQVNYDYTSKETLALKILMEMVITFCTDLRLLQQMAQAAHSVHLTLVLINILSISRASCHGASTGASHDTRPAQSRPNMLQYSALHLLSNYHTLHFYEPIYLKISNCTKYTRIPF